MLIKLSIAWVIWNSQPASACAANMGWLSLHGELFDHRISECILSSSLFLRNISFQEFVGVAGLLSGLCSGSVSTILLYILIQAPLMPSPQVSAQLSTAISIHGQVKSTECWDSSWLVHTLVWGCHHLLGSWAVVLGHRVTSDSQISWHHLSFYPFTSGTSK